MRVYLCDAAFVLRLTLHLLLFAFESVCFCMCVCVCAVYLSFATHNDKCGEFIYFIFRIFAINKINFLQRRADQCAKVFYVSSLDYDFC